MSLVEVHMDLGESLLSSALVNNRWLICGADSGYIIIVDCFYPLSQYAITKDQQQQQKQQQHQQQQQGGFNPKMVYCAPHHAGGIRYISSTTVPLHDDSHQLFKNPKYNHIVPYNQLRTTFDQPYSVDFAHKGAAGSSSGGKQTLIKHGSPAELPNQQPIISTINQSSFTATNTLLLQNENDTGSQPQQQQQNQYHNHNGVMAAPPTITFIITCSHDGTNNIFVLNENRNPDALNAPNIGQHNPVDDYYYQQQQQQQYNNQQQQSKIPLSSNAIPVSLLHTRALLPIQTLKAHASHCATFCTQTPYFLTAHDESKTRILVWDSNALKQGPIHIIQTGNKQITTMVWFENRKEFIATSRDGVVKTFALGDVFRDYEMNQL